MSGPGHPTDYIAFYRSIYSHHGQQENGYLERNGDHYDPYFEQEDWYLKTHGDPRQDSWRQLFVYRLKTQLGNRCELLWMVVRCRTSDTFFEPWKNPKYRFRIWYPAYRDCPCRDGWLNWETHLVYSEFTKTREVKEQMVTEAETGGPSRLRELVEREFGIGGPWVVPGLKDKLREGWLDRIDWDEICVGLRLLSTAARPASHAAAV